MTHIVTISASDHAALVAMAREAGMTQGQVVSRLIGMRAAVLGLERNVVWSDEDGDICSVVRSDAPWVRHSDLTAVVGL